MSERIIEIKVIPNAKKAEISVFGTGLKIKVNAPAENNKANHVVIEMLSNLSSIKTTSVLTDNYLRALSNK